mmetsp:Transcript_17038/g.40648  ORF Transcript_17038/g.40648 Transcript_17038/m.40648 type:complete len:201 (+) Transcript_17038:269-871(+)
MDLWKHKRLPKNAVCPPQLALIKSDALILRIPKWDLSSYHGVQQHTAGPDVSLCPIISSVAQDFRRHAESCASSGVSQHARTRFHCQPKITEFHLKVVREKNVCKLDVSVDDHSLPSSWCMEVLHCTHHLLEDVACKPFCKGSVAELHVPCDGKARHMLHHNSRLSIQGHCNLKKLHNVRMTELRVYLHLTLLQLRGRAR